MDALKQSCSMAIRRQIIDLAKFNPAAALPFGLRPQDFQMAMQDVYDFFYDVNSRLMEKGLKRLDDMLRPAMMSGILSDLVTVSLAKHSRVLTENKYPNGHPDLIKQGIYGGDAVKSAKRDEGIEVKTTKKKGGAVDTHGARSQWLCVFVYRTDTKTEPASARLPFMFTEVYLGKVAKSDFRRNARGELGTRTATLHKDGIVKLRESWIYLDTPV